MMAGGQDESEEELVMNEIGNPGGNRPVSKPVFGYKKAWETWERGETDGGRPRA